MSRTLVLIPARMAASRLPGKPLADIGGRPMIVHVMDQARAAGLGEVIVATDSDEISAAVEAAGGRAIMTRPDHPSGSDRIHEAAMLVDTAAAADRIINVQGDLPTIDPAIIRAAADLLDDPAVDIGTLASVITRPEEVANPNVVKVVGTPLSGRRLRALYFTRATAPSGEGPLYHHIGLYAYRRAALDRFVALPPAPLERRERLEQLRALENGMRIDVAVVDTVPLGVDTPEDLERARGLIAKA
ncbi:3-deoxy-manno-octulosonate cytidylyltransferase [Phreatobacter sp.]|uniref:3-deoxy-manno-octulosonate cytidylyltransferase n=1 Tax=Phreatobacter sp. TaxID=1966341 RepID=UPI003F706632